MIRTLVLGASLLAAPLQAAEYYFCWEGANGYTMTGQMSLAPGAINKPIVLQDDVTEFRIAGYHEGLLLGKWDLANRTDTTSWVVHFDPARNAFMTPGEVGLGVSQAWNANGDANDCGNPGFGFNLGNFAQDFCLNGAWIVDSGMPPETPFLVSFVPVDPECRVYAPLS